MNKGYDITGPEALTYSEVAEILSNEISKEISYIDIIEDAARKGMKQIGMNDWVIDTMMELFRIMRAGYVSETTTVVEHILDENP